MNKNGTLNIYHNTVLVNTFTYEGEEQVNAQLAQIFIAKEKRGVKTRIAFVPYVGKMKVTQKWNDEVLGLYEYKYEFEGIE